MNVLNTTCRRVAGLEGAKESGNLGARATREINARRSVTPTSERLRLVS